MFQEHPKWLHLTVYHLHPNTRSFDLACMSTKETTCMPRTVINAEDTKLMAAICFFF